MKRGLFLFIAWSLVLQNDTADAIFNFLTTPPKEETFIIVTVLINYHQLQQSFQQQFRAICHNVKLLLGKILTTDTNMFKIDIYIL